MNDKSRPNPLLDKSFDFALSIVRMVRSLQAEYKEYVLSKQVMRSGTAVGALVREAQNAESKKDFIHKLSIAQKECDETLYWLELIYQSDFINSDIYDDLYPRAQELLRIIRSAVITSKRNLRS